MSVRSEWKSKSGFLLAALGSAIGLGNIWRFPYIAFRNGGGAFLVPYLVALFLVGVPLLMLEFGLGHSTRRAFPQALAKIHPRFSWIGWWSVSFVMFGIVAYYSVVMAWCGCYVVYSVTQPWGDLSNVGTFFDESFLGAFTEGKPLAIYTDDGGLQLGRINWQIVAALAVVWFVNWLITRRQLQHGIELASKIFIPTLVVITAVLAAWSWTFEGARAGHALYLTPDWSRVFEPKTWIDAFGQIFFTLSLGFGIMVAYASYLPRESDIPTSAFLAGTGNCAFSILAGFAVFAAVGLLAHDRDIDLTRMQEISHERDAARGNHQPSHAVDDEGSEQLRVQAEERDRYLQFEQQMSSFGLVFKTYPAIITRIGGMSGRLFGVLFFLSLVVAGISSSISIVEAFLSALSDQFGWNRERIAASLNLTGFGLGLVFCTQSGLFWLDLVDHFITTYGLVVVAICESLIVGWLFPVKRLRKHLDEYHDFRFSKTLGIAMRLLITTMLLLTWLGLTQYEQAGFAADLGRFLLVASAIVLWIDEHWLDFNIRLVVPALLVFLLDQSLLSEVQSTYGGYPRAAVLSIGLGWLLATLLIGFGLSLASAPRVATKSD